MKVISILGTRPEITKLSPLLPAFDESFDHKVIHTGQHYDYNMDQVFFEQLALRAPDYNLNVGLANLSHAQQTAQMMVALEKIIVEERPDWVSVFADTNTPLAGALVACKLNVPLVHLEAGCRSFNKKAPEEINRIICDHCADLLLAPDEVARSNLLREGLNPKAIHVVGSTAIMAARRNAVLAEKTATVLTDLQLAPKEFVLLTIHRAENTNDPHILRGLIEAINTIAEIRPIVFPLHPRTRKILEQEGIPVDARVRIIEPADYMKFLTLLKNAQIVMSDSGGIQEEAAALDTPCLIIRNETEWTYLLDLGKNLLIGTRKDDIVRVVSELLADPASITKMAAIPLGPSTDVPRNIVEVLKNV